MIALRIDLPVLIFAGGADDRHRAALRPVSRAAQHPARSGLRAEGSGRPAVRRAGRRAVPRVARHDADRAVDGAARRRPGCSRRACSTSAAWISGLNIDNVVTFAVSPRVERLQAGARRGAVRAPRGGARARCLASRASPTSLVAAARGQQLGQQRVGARVQGRTRTPTPTRATTRSAPATSGRSASR